MICVPSNPRLPYLWKIACFSKEGAECRWRGWWWITERLHHWAGAAAASHKPFLTTTCIMIPTTQKSLNEAVGSVSAGIFARNKFGLFWGICLAELPSCFALGLPFPLGFLGYPRESGVPLIPVGILVGRELRFVVAIKASRYFWISQLCFHQPLV